jgi:hypothetical protein
MSKIMMGLTVSTLLFLSGCTSCESNKSETDAVKKEKIAKTNTNKQVEVVTPVIIAKPKQALNPFKPSIETNINQDEVISESLEELESEVFKTIQPQINEEMQNIPDCLEKAETKEEAFACSKTLRGLNKELSMAMGDFTEEAPEGYDDDFIWNEETKVDMIKEIEAGTQAMQEMQMCMQTSKTPEELEKCLKL